MKIYSAHLDEPAMCQLARVLAPAVKPRDFIALSGGRGAGKSTFARALIAEKTGIHDVPSPTYTLVQQYDLPKGAGILWHFDLYRLASEKEVHELGWEEALGEGLVLAEWPERAKQHLPQGMLGIDLSIGPQSGGRNIEIEGSPAWAERLNPILPPPAR